MPLQNRVTPLGELVADSARGLLYGNRGCLHDETGRIRRRYNGKRWIGCRLEFRGWRRGPLLQPGRFTELFFLDEATAFAAGHRPCARAAGAPTTTASARSGARSSPGRSERTRSTRSCTASASIPARARTGCMTQRSTSSRTARSSCEDGAPHLVLGAELLRWTPAGYTERSARPAGGEAVLVTPPSLVAVLRAGWEPDVPLLHPTARGE